MKMSDKIANETLILTA